MKKILQWIKKHKVVSVIIVLVILVASFFLLKGGKDIQREFVTVTRTTVAQEVDVTGRVEPAKKVELAIQSGGKVSSIAVKVGDKVALGKTLLSVNSDDLNIQLSRQQADLSKSKIALVKLVPKTTSVDDLEKAYDDAFSIITASFLDFPEILDGLDEILGHSYLSANNVRSSYGQIARDYRDSAERQYFVARNNYKEVLKTYRLTSRTSDPEAIETLLDLTYNTMTILADAVKMMNTFVDYIENRVSDDARPAELDTDQSTLDTFTTDTNTDLSDILEIKDVIKDAKAGITDEGSDVESLQFDIQQAQLDIDDTQVQISHRVIRAPIDGVVTDIQAEVGETISANTPVISLISSNQFQIEANLPESDISKVVVGAEAEIILDAYGSDVIFKAKVVSIDPAEVILDGVATYKTTLQFAEADPRIKSGMTADVNIKGQRKENVFAVPQRAVTAKNGAKFVQILVGTDVVEKEVKTGLRGSDGNVEITEGLNEGDQVIVFTPIQ